MIYPQGCHLASLDEVVARFGAGSGQRQAVTDRLRRISHLATATGRLDRLLVFGSYVSDNKDPNDVDVILVMRNDFRSEDCLANSSVLFDHARADEELGASVFLGSARYAARRAAGAILGLLTNETRRPAPRHRGDSTMIQNDQELKVARERMGYLLDLLARLRVSSRPEELPLVTGGYRAEVERMHREVVDYLTQPAIKTTVDDLSNQTYTNVI